MPVAGRNSDGRATLRANDDETQAPRKFKLEGIGEPSRGHAQQELPNGSRGWGPPGKKAEGGGCGGGRRHERGREAEVGPGASRGLAGIIGAAETADVHGR